MSKKKMQFNGSQKTFQFTIKTDNLSTGSSSNNQFKLPLTSFGVINFKVNWGDGSSNIITMWNQAEVTHTYASIGTYTIVITGTIRSFIFGNSGDRLKITNVLRVSALIINFANVFNGCANLTWTAIDAPVLETTSLEAFFKNCVLFNGNIGNWNVSNVTNMVEMFRGATAFNQDISSWNVANVINMQSMFSSANSFNQNIGGWNVSNVTNMAAMFNTATAFNQDISSWNVANVITMFFMFSSATYFNQDISSWNVANVINMGSMFSSANSFNQNIGGWNVSNVTNFTGFMFAKNALNYSSSNLDAIYNGWSSRPVKPNLNIGFGTIKHTAASIAGKSILTSSPNLWTITDGGI